jgi:anti-anti-sigma factor
VAAVVEPAAYFVLAQGRVPVDNLSLTMTVIPEDIVVVDLPAEISYDNAVLVRSRLTLAFRPGVTMVIANLSRSEFIDTSGIREMAMAHKLAETRQVVLRIVAPPLIRRRLALTCLDRIIPVSSSLTEVLERYGR